MQKNTPKIEPIRTLRYSELVDFCNIIGIELLELAKPMHLIKETLYNNRYLRKGSDDDVIELSRLDGIIAFVGEEDYEIALAELQMTKEERENPRNTHRLTWGEGKKVLKLCGVTQAELADAILLSASQVSHLMGWYSRKLIPLRDIHTFKMVVGEKNFETALKMVRK